jgi:hypothetical protein
MIEIPNLPPPKKKGQQPYTNHKPAKFDPVAGIGFSKWDDKNMIVR